MSAEITFKTKHNGWTFITDIMYQGRKVGYIVAMGGTGAWVDDKFTPCTDFRVMTIKGEEKGQAQSLGIAKVLVLALQKQKQEIGRYKRR